MVKPPTCVQNKSPLTQCGFFTLQITPVRKYPSPFLGMVATRSYCCSSRMVLMTSVLTCGAQSPGGGLLSLQVSLLVADLERLCGRPKSHVDRHPLDLTTAVAPHIFVMAMISAKMPFFVTEMSFQTKISKKQDFFCTSYIWSLVKSFHK